MSDAPILEVRNVTRKFGGLIAVNNLSFSVRRNSIHGLIGPNGAGKTTTFSLISGYYKPTSGQILYDGQDVSGMRTSHLARRGLIRTFQGTTLFQEFSVLDNVRVGCHRSAGASFIARITGGDAPVERAAEKKAREILELFDLAALADEPTSSLPHGHQRALGMAVALAADPAVILLDEPFTGMNPEETRRMMEHVRRIRDEHDMTIMLVEHDMQAVMGLCERITVMNFGQLLMEGTPQEIANDPRVIEAYLGRDDDAA
ncbi:ABC transporter ATP-binding protein [Pseudaminobacter arsenicus]|uniref:ABC transporter ATP-binding protein n=1 Tax=Borborobacter arsenicus TaxID=1851146 RepID=A0A432V6N9_9HYPH|nr:ABC transporter ATP-binding protein [Pseudaminobacter arsenicus]RUM97820.1 ABC transporter ATP-binding protein [Pseudaminobacter arsenicus]